MYLLFLSVLFNVDAICVDDVVNSIGAVVIVILVVSGVVDVDCCVDVFFVAVVVISDVRTLVVDVVFNGTAVSGICVDFKFILVVEVDSDPKVKINISKLHLFTAMCSVIEVWLLFVMFQKKHTKKQRYLPIVISIQSLHDCVMRRS